MSFFSWLRSWFGEGSAASAPRKAAPSASRASAAAAKPAPALPSAAPETSPLSELDANTTEFAVLANRAIEVATPEEAALLARVNAQLESGKFQVPVLPDSHVRVLDIANKPHASAQEIASVIKRDAGIATEVISLVNSAAYMPATPIRDLQRAIVHVGTQRVRGLMFGVAMRLTVFRKADSARARQLWSHSIGAGLMAREIARVAGRDPEEAFLAGLLHDVGKTVILGMVSEEERRNPKLRLSDPLLWRILEGTHTAVGTHIAKAWKLASNLQEVIELHHKVQPDSPALVAIVALADDVCRKFGIGSPMLPVKFTDHPSFDALRLPSLAAFDLVQRLPALVESDREFVRSER